MNEQPHSLRRVHCITVLGIGPILLALRGSRSLDSSDHLQYNPGVLDQSTPGSREPETRGLDQVHGLTV